VSESELRQEIGRIARESSILEDAIQKMRALLGVEIGETNLLVRPARCNFSAFREPAVAEFLESRTFPFRGVYTAPLGAAGVLIACVGSWGAPSGAIQHLVEHAGTRLSPLLDGAPEQTRRQYEAA
jgi:hypothetical protein